MTRATSLTRAVGLSLVTLMLIVTLPVAAVEAQERPPETVATQLDELQPDDGSKPTDDSDTPASEPETGTDGQDHDVTTPETDEPSAEHSVVRSEPKVAPHAFTSLGIRAYADVDVTYRVRLADGTWSDWGTVEPLDEEDGPDPGTEEDRSLDPGPYAWTSEAIWTGEAEAAQFSVVGGDLDDIDVTIIDSMGLSESLLERTVRAASSLTMTAPAEAASYSGMVSRKQWGANESWRSGSPSYAEVKFSVLHHTAGSNNYSRDEAPGVVRGIYHWHTQGNGWSDIGYNILVDRYGTVYEGRYGGVDRGVVGAHARNWNSGSFGVAIMGNFDVATAPSAAINATADVMAWKYGVHGLDPQTDARVSHNGRSIPTMIGHRDVGSTVCPGRYITNSIMDQMRERIESNPIALGEDAFRDVPASNRYHEDIMAIARVGITRGCNPPTNDMFCPRDTVTREQMAAFLVRGLGLSKTSGVRFRDVPAGSTFAADIDRLATAGVTKGCNPPTNDRFCPSDGVTREQMASFLSRGLDLSSTSGVRFRDVSSTNAHRQDIDRLATAGITRGCNPPTNDMFCPRDTVTREQMGAFLSRGLKL